MGAYFAALVGVFLLWLFFGDTLKDIVRQLKRIADRLESQENKAPSKESE